MTETTDWRSIASYLYKTIKPIGGILGSNLTESTIERKRFAGLWVEFTMNEFDYVDPFYGPQKSTAPFKMFVNLADAKEAEQIQHIHQLRDVEFKDLSNLVGAFSNSLRMEIRRLTFGKIQGQHIDFELEYSFLYNDWYGLEEGPTLEDAPTSAFINQKLLIKESLAVLYNTAPYMNSLNKLDPEVYDVASAHEATDTGNSFPGRTQYRIPFRSIVPYR